MRKLKGEKMGDMMGVESERKVMLPNIRIPLSDIPEAKDWKVGDKYFLEFDSKLIGLHQDEKSGKGYAEFEVVGMEEPETEEEESEEEDEEDEDEGEETNEPAEKGSKSKTYKRT